MERTLYALEPADDDAERTGEGTTFWTSEAAARDQRDYIARVLGCDAGTWKLYRVDGITSDLGEWPDVPADEWELLATLYPPTSSRDAVFRRASDRLRDQADALERLAATSSNPEATRQYRAQETRLRDLATSLWLLTDEGRATLASDSSD